MDSLEKQPNKLQIILVEFLKKYFTTLLFVILAIFFLLAYYLVLVPRFQQAAQKIQVNSSEEEKKYILTVQKLTDLRSLDRAYKQVDPALIAKVNEFLPDEYIQEQLFLELEQVIIKNGYAVNSISIQKELGESNDGLDKRIGRVKVQVSISAIDYLDLKKLLAIMENNVRLMDIQKLTFSPSGQSAEFDFYTYFLKTK